jgi:hypothetical protein
MEFGISAIMFMNTAGAYNLRYGGLGNSSDEGGLNSNVVAVEFTQRGLSLQAGTRYLCFCHRMHVNFPQILKPNVHVEGFRPGLRDHELMNNREALAISIDNKSVPCPFSQQKPWLLSEKWLESGVACYSGKCVEHEEICSKVCKQHNLRVLPSLSGVNTENLGERVPGDVQRALQRLREHKQQVGELPCASLSTSHPISTQSARSPVLLSAASGSSFSQQPVEKFSSPFWYCGDDETPAQSSHQPVEKFSSPFWYCRDDETPEPFRLLLLRSLVAKGRLRTCRRIQKT